MQPLKVLKPLSSHKILVASYKKVVGLVVLVVVLVVPEGIGRVFDIIRERLRPRVVHREPISPDLARLDRALKYKP